MPSTRYALVSVAALLLVVIHSRDAGGVPAGGKRQREDGSRDERQETKQDEEVVKRDEWK